MSKRWERLRGSGYRGWELQTRPGKSSRIYRVRHDQSTRQDRRRSLFTSDPEEAQRRLEDWVNIHDDMVDIDPRRIEAALCMARYYEHHGRTLASDSSAASSIRKIVGFIGNKTVAELTVPEQERLIKHLLAPDKKASTVTRDMAVLSASLNWCVKRGELASCPHILSVKPQEPETRVASIDELARFVEAIRDDHLERFFWLGIGTAARPGAILELTRERCDIEGRHIALNQAGRVQTKKRRPTVRMAEGLVPLVSSVRFGLLVTRKGEPLASVRSVWNRTRDSAKLPEYFQPYILRRTAASWMHSESVPFEQIEAFLGHRMPNPTTERYIHVRLDFQVEAAVAIDRLIREIGRVGARPISVLSTACVTAAYHTFQGHDVTPWKVVDVFGAKSNRLLEELAQWNEALQGSSMAIPGPSPG